MSRIKHITIKPKDEADTAIIQQFNEYQSEWLLKALEAREEIRPEMTQFKQALRYGATPSPSLFLSDENSTRIAGMLTDALTAYNCAAITAKTLEALGYDMKRRFSVSHIWYAKGLCNDFALLTGDRYAYVPFASAKALHGKELSLLEVVT